MPFVPFPEFAPDQPDFHNTGSNLIQNVLPLTKTSYGPFPSLTPVSTALTARCQGAYAMMDPAGNVRLFAGDATKLYRMDPSSASPADVSKAGGYSTGSTDRWEMTLFGSRIIATNFNDPIQSYIEGSSALFANLITTGQTDLKARSVAIIKDFVFFGNTTDGADGPQPQRVRWSAIDDPTNFPALGSGAAATVQSDAQDLVGDQGWVQGIVGNLGTSDGAVFQERAVIRAQYIGPPAIWDFHVAEGVRGTPAPGSIAQLSNIAYYLGEDGFYAFNGTASQPIGFENVDHTFFRDVDQSLLYRVTSTVDPINKIVYWGYPGAGHDGIGNCNRIIAYHVVLDRWAITAANDIQIEVLFRALSFGYTLEQLDLIYPNLDLMPVSLDSRTLTGGRSVLSAFDISHMYNQFTGANLAVTVETSETQPLEDKRALVTYFRPMIETSATVAPSIQVASRNRLNDPIVFSSPVLMDTSGSCFTRVEGRYFKVRMTLPAGSSFDHIDGVDIPTNSIVPSGDIR